MTKSSQAKKNVKLLNNLTSYLQDNPHIVSSLPSGASFVLFADNDLGLNQINMKIMDSLIDNGSTVIKAKKTNDNKTPWKFTPVYA